MEKLTKTVDSEELTVEERNLLSVAHKNVIGAECASWRVISSVEQEEEGHGNEDHVTLVKDYRSKIEVASNKVCDGILKLLDSHLVPSSTIQSPRSSTKDEGWLVQVESSCIRYHVVFQTGSEKDEAKNTMVAYKAAQSCPPPILLGLGWCSIPQLS